MRKMIVVMSLMLLGVKFYGVTTDYLTDYKYENLQQYTYSNVSFGEDGEIGLARETSIIYEEEAVVWSLANWKNDILVGTGEPAKVIQVGNKQTVWEKTNHVMVSDIEVVKSEVLVSAIPDSTIYVLDSQLKEQQSYRLTNQYIWDMTVFNGKVYIFTGLPAEVYELANGKISKVTELKYENNLTRAKVIGNQLYFSSERVLYRLKGTKPVAVAAFEKEISDFIEYQGDLLVTVSLANKKGDNKPQNNNNNNAKNNRPYERSSLYRVRPNGEMQEMFQKTGFRFMSLSYVNDRLIIGTDKDGGYIEMDMKKDKTSFHFLGLGKFASMMTMNGDVYALTIYPSRLLKIGSQYAKKGVFQSEVIDTKNYSGWGTPYMDTEILPGSKVNLYTRSGANDNPSSWEDWSLSNSKITSYPNRYIQYKVELTSDGKDTPVFMGLTIPYAQKNSPPQITKIDYEYKNDEVKIKWVAEDDNGDKLSYDIFISAKGNEWVQLNSKPWYSENYSLKHEDYPEGKYICKIVASDRISNPEDSSLSASRQGREFYIDSSGPAIGEIKWQKQGQEYRVTLQVSDSLMPLKAVSYNLNADNTVNLVPVDGIYDELQEEFEFKVKADAPVFLQIKALDFIGNKSSKGVLLR